MSAKTIMQEQVAPIVGKLFAEVDFTKFKPVATEIHEELDWVIYIGEKFVSVNEKALEELKARIKNGEDLKDELIAVGTACRKDMGEEIFESYIDDHNIETEHDLGTLFVVENLFGAIIQKVHNFAEVELMPHQALAEQVQAELREKHELVKEGTIKLVRVASKELIESFKDGAIDFVHLPYKQFEDKVADEGNAGNEVIDKAITKALDAMLDHPENGEIIARIIEHSDVPPLMAILQADELIQKTLMATMKVAMRTAHAWLNADDEKELNEELIVQAIRDEE